MNCYVVVGNISYPAETTCTAPTKEGADTIVAMFNNGGSMYLPGDKVDTVVYPPGSEIPPEVAIHICGE